ncbi:hypothetical protein OG948_43560 (plasmid) [Embleya sp. NBC_00888]|uniref:hypothetical protein n=1 Tax=Embleya sp. NBC_00888 TaxID=2975960 RepID=UPI002F91BD6F|nr:hypothetical protein OG948_43560 [Embleya sp. NBC_00888]
MTRHGGEPLRSGTPEHTALEAELRDWLGRRADAVTPATVRPREVPLPIAPARRRRVPLRLAVPVAAFALAAAGWAVAGSISAPDAPRPVTVPPAGPAPEIGGPTTTAPASTPESPADVTAPKPSALSTAPPSAPPGTDQPAVPPRTAPPDTPPGTAPGGRRGSPVDNRPPSNAPPPATGEGSAPALNGAPLTARPTVPA